jgi:hypothetical protein
MAAARSLTSRTVTTGRPAASREVLSTRTGRCAETICGTSRSGFSVSPYVTGCQLVVPEGSANAATAASTPVANAPTA